jgi:hypothetical protein
MIFPVYWNKYASGNLFELRIMDLSNISLCCHDVLYELKVGVIVGPIQTFIKCGIPTFSENHILVLEILGSCQK